MVVCGGLGRTVLECLVLSRGSGRELKLSLYSVQKTCFGGIIVCEAELVRVETQYGVLGHSFQMTLRFLSICLSF